MHDSSVERLLSSAGLKPDADRSCPCCSRCAAARSIQMPPMLGVRTLSAVCLSMVVHMVSAAPKPHIVYILSDNLGWCACPVPSADAVGCTASVITTVATPRPPHTRMAPSSAAVSGVGRRGNVGYHRHPDDRSETRTPNINELVATGVELDRLYTYKFCSPSRGCPCRSLCLTRRCSY
eukprot:SAG11_NODE_3877_length_2175_cov_1.701349_3_plen_179_part_00